MNSEEKIWLKTKEGQEFFIYKTERCDMQKELTETINKLQNNWNELKKWLKDYRKNKDILVPVSIVELKMQELENNND